MIIAFNKDDQIPSTKHILNEMTDVPLESPPGRASQSPGIQSC
jgi:hypothetical protein